MAREQLAYLSDIAREVRRAQIFVAGYTWERFRDDTEKQYAVQHAISIIGEAVSHLSPENRKALSALPLEQMRGMRNILQHVYWNVKADILWKVATKELSLVAQSVEKLLAGD